MYWPIEGGECLDGMFRCKNHKNQKTRWRRRRENRSVAIPRGAPAVEDEEEEWEKEELAAMWKFQGACDANAVIHEREQRIREQNREIRKRYKELQNRKDRGETEEYEIKWDDLAKPANKLTRSHSNSNISEGKVRFIQKFCIGACKWRRIIYQPRWQRRKWQKYGQLKG